MDIFQKVWAGVFLFDFHLLVIVGLDALLNNLVRLLRSDPFVEIVVAHQHRRGAATGQALDEFNRKFPVLGRLDALGARVQAELAAEMFVQPVGTAERATQGAADSDLISAGWFRVEHGIKADQFVNVDRLELEFLRDPLDGLARNPAGMFLYRVQHHQRSAPLLRVVRDHFVDLRFEAGWNVEVHAKSPVVPTPANDEWRIPNDERIPRSA